MKRQFIIAAATVLMVGAAIVGVNLGVILAMDDAEEIQFAQVDTHFEQVDARFEPVDRRLYPSEARFEKCCERIDARIDALERRMCEGFSELCADIARPEGLIQGIHGTRRATVDNPTPQSERQSWCPVA